MTEETTWQRVCVLCAIRVHRQLQRELKREPTQDELARRQTRLQAGHCCATCTGQIAADIHAIATLAQDAAAWIEPRSTMGGGSRPVPASRPPINVEAVSPELALVLLEPSDPDSAVTILECLESWERLIRDERRMSAYGPVSAHRTALAGTGSTTLTLLSVCRFLGSQVPYATTEPDFSLESFAAQMRACAGTLRRWDRDAQDHGSRYRVACPTTTDEGECGAPLLLSLGNPVHCRHCNRDWNPVTLLHIAGRDADIWLDSEAISLHLGIPERTIRHWGQRGRVARRGQLYRLGDITRRADQGA
jgi:hypothetical protein